MIFPSSVQSRLKSRYDLEIPYDVCTFISHDREAAEYLTAVAGDGNERYSDTRHETVFVHQDEDSLDIMLYLDKELLDLFESCFANENANLKTDNQITSPTIDDVCTVVEGVSHAVCLLWHAHYDRQVRPLDLELQAEIDKFMMLVDQFDNPVHCQRLHHQLFTNCRFSVESGTLLHERYLMANEFAARYCRWLIKEFIHDTDQKAMDNELARFYRLPGRDKFERIRRLH